jgi:undecaprenyl-diphosphatase
MTKKVWVRLLLFLVIAVVALIGAFYCDAAVQHWMAHHQNHTAKIVFRNVSKWGDWPAHAILGGVLLLLAWWRGNKKWKRIFLTMLVACLLAGVSARVIKITTGRARPSVRTESVWNGPRFSSKYHAFPSGHTAASAAFFGTLLFVSLRLGLALMAVPLLIAFSRMYVGAHYLSDVLFAAILGIMCAFLAVKWLLPKRAG